MKKIMIIFAIVLCITTCSFAHEPNRGFMSFVPDYVGHIVQQLDLVMYVIDAQTPNDVYNELNRLWNIRSFSRLSAEIYNIENMLEQHGLKIEAPASNKVERLKQRLHCIEQFLFCTVVNDTKKLFLIDTILSSSLVSLLQFDETVAKKYNDAELISLFRAYRSFQTAVKSEFYNAKHDTNALQLKRSIKNDIDSLIMVISDCDRIPFHLMSEEDMINELDKSVDNNIDYYFYLIKPRLNALRSLLAEKTFNLELSDIQISETYEKLQKLTAKYIKYEN